MQDNLKTISHYKIIEKLGEGGMGEVYLVADMKLNRKAALKILPTAFAFNRKHLNRFLQEARLAATLNHPNVCTIYEINDEGEVPFISMEYVEGETLAAKIGGKSLAIAEIVEIALQIADALDEAHHSGIIHRDIKAANVVINKRGSVKVLDFGLAKTSDLETSEQEVTRAKTESGMLVGTVQYMSPEQALGKELDGRTDLWSLGVLLYEMATGELPFKGATVAAIFDAILHREPTAATELNPNLPPELEQIIFKLLEKDCELRYQTASDLRADLKRLRRNSFYDSKAEINAPSGASVSRKSNDSAGKQTGKLNPRPTIKEENNRLKLNRSHFGIIAGSVLLLLICVFAAIAFNVYHNYPKPQNDVAFQPGEIERLTNLGKVNEAAVSPDGKYVVYVSNEGEKESLWLKQIQSGSNIQVVAPQNVSFQGVAISPDSNWIYYNLWDKKSVGEIFRIPVLGGAAQRVIHDCMPGITISPDGSRLAFVRSDSSNNRMLLISANVDGTDERPLVVNNFEAGPLNTPAWSPDGKTIAYGGAKYISPTTSFSQILEVPANGGEPKIIWTSNDASTFLGNGLVWLPDKSGLLVTAGDLRQFSLQIWKIPYPEGEVRQIIKDFNSYNSLSISSDGKQLVTTQQDVSMSVWTVPLDNRQQPRKITSGRLEGQGVVWMPDGRIVYSSVVGGNFDIWIANADGSDKKQLTINAANNVEPCVSANGKYIAFASSRGGAPNVWRINPDGSNLKQITEGGIAWAVNCSPFNESLFVIVGVESKVGIGRVSIEGGKIEGLVKEHVIARPAISNDGKQIAYVFWNDVEKQRNFEILNIETGEKRRFELPPQAVRNINQPPLILRFTPDGKALSYISDENEVSNIWILPLDGGKPRQITDFNESYIAYFNWSPDGKQLAVSRGKRTSDVVLIKNAK